MTSGLDLAFERLARGFLATHPQIKHEWRPVAKWHGTRTDLVCAPGLPNEVFASLLGHQIAVGATAATDHEDFEDFGRSLSDDQVAQEAFDCFVALLREHGHIDAAA